MNAFSYAPSSILTYIAAIAGKHRKSIYDLSKLEYACDGAYDMRAIKAARRRNHRAGIHHRRK